MVKSKKELQKTVELNSWDEFREHISQLRKKIDDDRDDSKKRNYPMLFRGQSDSNWKLKSTLCREAGGDEKWEILVNKYLEVLNSVYEDSMSILKKQDDFPQFSKKVAESMPYLNEKETLPFMVYVRHLGFPSPLLDWSRLPYVAAYFAFRHLTQNPKKNNKVSIFVFIERLNYKNPDMFCTSKPFFWTVGPNIFTHERHHLQQCEYTYCLEEKKEDVFFKPDYLVLSTEEKSNQGETLLKITLPASIRNDVLTRLNEIDINEFTLFNTEDALMFKLKEKHRSLFKAKKNC